MVPLSVHAPGIREPSSGILEGTVEPPEIREGAQPRPPAAGVASAPDWGQLHAWAVPFF